jgi:Tfp pilus assembly protein PilN
MAFSSNTPKITSKTTAYLRVSTIDQDIDKNKAAILALANSKVLGHVQFKAVDIQEMAKLFEQRFTWQEVQTSEDILV